MIRQSTLFKTQIKHFTNIVPETLNARKNFSLTRFPRLGGKVKQEIKDFRVFEINKNGEIAGKTPLSSTVLQKTENERTHDSFEDKEEELERCSFGFFMIHFSSHSSKV